jgi:hypothetical protein
MKCLRYIASAIDVIRLQLTEMVSAANVLVIQSECYLPRCLSHFPYFSPFLSLPFFLLRSLPINFHVTFISFRTTNMSAAITMTQLIGNTISLSAVAIYPRRFQTCTRSMKKRAYKLPIITFKRNNLADQLYNN